MYVNYQFQTCIFNTTLCILCYPLVTLAQHWRTVQCVMESPPAQQTQNIRITCIQRRPNVFDIGPALYKSHTIVLCLLGVNASLGVSPFQDLLTRVG